MDSPDQYEPPLLVLFTGPGPVPAGYGFTCNTGPQATKGNCASGWTASSTCSTGCTAQGWGTAGCRNGGGAGSVCVAGNEGPLGMICGLTVCCSGSSGTGSGGFPICTNGNLNNGDCANGTDPCGDVCLTYNPCSPPSS
jgi:hypothetical protein